MAAWTGLGCYFASDAVSWRLCLSLQIVAPLLLLMGSPWLPESPRWLIGHQRGTEGLEVLRKLHVTKVDSSDIAAKEEYYQISKQIELEKQTGVMSLWAMLKRSSYRKRILCGILVQYAVLSTIMLVRLLNLGFRFAAQSTGVLVVNNYQVLLYGNLGLSGWLPLLLCKLICYTNRRGHREAIGRLTSAFVPDGIYTSWAAFMNWVNSLLLDRVGRKPVIIAGLCGCIAMMCIETAMVAKYAGGPNRAGNAMGVLFLFLFVTFYGGSQDASSYVYCSEIFPTGVRAQGLGTSIACLFAS